MSLAKPSQKLSGLVCAIDAINEWTGNIVSYLCLGMLVLIMFETISRYLFSVTHSWAEEISVFLFGAYFFLAGGYVLLHKGHVIMDVLYNRFSPKTKLVIALVTSLCVFVFCGLLLWQSLDFFLRSWESRETSMSVWGPPIYPVKALMPLGYLLFLLQGLALFIRTLITLFGGKR